MACPAHPRAMRFGAPCGRPSIASGFRPRNVVSWRRYRHAFGSVLQRVLPNGESMLPSDTSALTVLAVLITRPTSVVPPAVTIALALVCVLAGVAAFFPEFRRRTTRRPRAGRTVTAPKTAGDVAPAAHSSDERA